MAHNNNDNNHSRRQQALPIFLNPNESFESILERLWNSGYITTEVHLTLLSQLSNRRFITLEGARRATIEQISNDEICWELYNRGWEDRHRELLAAVMAMESDRPSIELSDADVMEQRESTPQTSPRQDENAVSYSPLANSTAHTYPADTRPRVVNLQAQTSVAPTTANGDETRQTFTLSDGEHYTLYSLPSWVPPSSLINLCNGVQNDRSQQMSSRAIRYQPTMLNNTGLHYTQSPTYFPHPLHTEFGDQPATQNSARAHHHHDDNNVPLPLTSDRPANAPASTSRANNNPSAHNPVHARQAYNVPLLNTAISTPAPAATPATASRANDNLPASMSVPAARGDYVPTTLTRRQPVPASPTAHTSHDEPRILAEFTIRKPCRIQTNYPSTVRIQQQPSVEDVRAGNDYQPPATRRERKSQRTVYVCTAVDRRPASRSVPAARGDNVPVTLTRRQPFQAGPSQVLTAHTSHAARVRQAENTTVGPSLNRTQRPSRVQIQQQPSAGNDYQPPVTRQSRRAVSSDATEAKRTRVNSPRK